MKSILLLGMGIAALSSPSIAGERKVSAAKIQVFTKLFNEANTDGNSYLDYEEFSNSYGASPRPVITEIRFDELASYIKVATVRGISEAERGIFLDDFIYANGGLAIKPSKSEIFWAADDDDSDGLDIDEFEATRVTRASTPASIIKPFNRIDKDDNGIISPAEWGIEVKPA